MLDFLLVFSLPKLVFDDEMCGQALRFVRDVKPLDDLPVGELIDQLMADQHLIMAAHTMAHWPEELYLPSAIVDRDNRESVDAARAPRTPTSARARRSTAGSPPTSRSRPTPPSTPSCARIIRSGLVAQTELPEIPVAADADPRRRRSGRAPPQPAARGRRPVRQPGGTTVMTTPRPDGGRPLRE